MGEYVWVWGDKLSSMGTYQTHEEVPERSCKSLYKSIHPHHPHTHTNIHKRVYTHRPTVHVYAYTRLHLLSYWWT